MKKLLYFLLVLLLVVPVVAIAEDGSMVGNWPDGEMFWDIRFYENPEGMLLADIGAGQMTSDPGNLSRSFEREGLKYYEDYTFPGYGIVPEKRHHIHLYDGWPKKKKDQQALYNMYYAELVSKWGDPTSDYYVDDKRNTIDESDYISKSSAKHIVEWKYGIYTAQLIEDKLYGPPTTSVHLYKEQESATRPAWNSGELGISPLIITGVTLTKNSIGEPVVSLDIDNISDNMDVDAFDVGVRCRNAYGEIVKRYGIDEECYATSQSDTIKAGEIRRGSNTYWTLHGYSAVKTVEVALTRIHTTDGTTIDIIPAEQVWVKSK